MKSIKALALVGAVALFSTAGFTSCKPKNEPSNGQAEYNGDVVKTEFAIALPKEATGNSNVRYMPASTVQRDGLEQFQGITDIVLVPFTDLSTAVNPGDKTLPITSSSTRLANNIVLSPNVTKADIQDKASKAKVYSDVSIPLTTASFLFYGKSAATGSKFGVGSLIADTANAKQPAAFTFSLEQIQNDASVLTANSTHGGDLLAYLTSVANAKDATENIQWSDYTNSQDAGMTDMATIFKSIHGLSSFEVARIMTDLNQTLAPLTSPIAVAIKTAIANSTYVNVDGNGVVTMKSPYDQYPQEYNLPEGSIDIQWVQGSHSFQVGTYSGMTSPEKYVYPTSLWYFVNSSIVTSNSSKKAMYNNVNSWSTILTAHNNGVAVSSQTRAVAIVDSIQYAVARLDVQVKLASLSLADNSDLIEGEAIPVDCTPGSGLEITGILIGGQKQVGWDFKPTSDVNEYTIYDNVMTPAPTAMKASTTYSDWNHTLVLENGTADVKIAVEMVNSTGQDFYGHNNELIPDGGKFYVIATLTADDATKTGGHVFKQDYVTKAQLNLKNLKAAYNSIPDLRSPELEIGFSVNLTWETGHTYTIDFDD